MQGTLVLVLPKIFISATGSRIDLTKGALVALLDLLPDNSYFDVICFGSIFYSVNS